MANMDLEKINFGYSLKNIPIPSGQAYLKNFIEKLESFINRLRWKVFFYLSNGESDSTADKFETFGFKSEYSAPASEDLKLFENDLYDLAKNIEFKPSDEIKRCNKFQHQLSQDIKSIKSSNNLFVPADKTTNVYKVKTADYRKLLTSNITKQYKKANIGAKDEIDSEAKQITSRLRLDDRVEQMAKRKAFITLKDLKENFFNAPKCRLINPAKSEIGKISKVILEQLNTNIPNATGYQQWRSTKSIIKWFNSIPNKDTCHFLKFDVVEFYPSIGENLLNQALNFAKTFQAIAPEQIEIIQHCQKSLLFDDSSSWVKRENEMFDVSVSVYLFIITKIT